MTTYHFIKEDLEKAELFVKPFVRTKKGKLEHVKGHTRQYVIGQPISVQEQSEWAKKWKKLLENIKYAFTHGDFNEKEAIQELKDKFSMSFIEANTYVQQWKGELQVFKKEQEGLVEAEAKKFVEEHPPLITTITESIPPVPQELVDEIKFPPGIILGISNSTLEKWASLTDAQKKEIERVKKQFFYYKINKHNPLSRLVFITQIGTAWG